MLVIRGSTNSAMTGGSDPPRAQHKIERIRWEGSKVGRAGGLTKLSGRWSSGGDVARDGYLPRKSRV